MNAKVSPPKRIAVSIHPDYSPTGEEVQPLKKILNQEGADSLYVASVHDPELKDAILKGAFEVVIALGGDGTMLRTTRICAPAGVPVLGINLGHFGFLMAIHRQEWDELLPRFMKGDYTVEERMMLTAILVRDGKSLENWQVINDAVVCRGRSVRPIEIEARVGEYEVARYFADGLITSTPTGSTAYALAAGGPILPPNLRNFLIIPVAPHRSLERAIILPEDSTVTLTVRTTHEAVLSVDGQTPSAVENGDQVAVHVSENTAKFIQFHDPGTYYHKLLKGLSNNSYPTSAA